MKVNKVKKGLNGVFFLRRWGAVLIVCIVVGALCVYFYYRIHHMQSFCPIQKIVFIDNKRLTDDELMEVAGIKARKSLLTVSCREIGRQMLLSPWIKAASVRKEFPGTLSITIQETEPFALLDVNGHLFLIDERGRILEELKDNAVPFLPTIVSDPNREKDAFSEALNLVLLLNKKGLTAGRDHVEVIAHKPNSISIVMDGTVIKIGSGAYEEKLERFSLLETDLRERNMPAEYIDLRFGDKAIVKPIISKRTE